MTKKIWIEDLIREVDKEQRKGPPLDLKAIAERAERKMKAERERRFLLASVGIFFSFIFLLLSLHRFINRQS